MEKQMTIDDYLNSDKVSVMQTAPAENYINNKVETIEAEPIEYNNLNKEELITVLAAKDRALDNYRDTIEQKEAAHKKEVEDLNHFYTQRTLELHNLVKYYERKLNVLRDIITLETGGEK